MSLSEGNFIGAIARDIVLSEGGDEEILLNFMNGMAEKRKETGVVRESQNELMLAYRRSLGKKLESTTRSLSKQALAS